MKITKHFGTITVARIRDGNEINTGIIQRASCRNWQGAKDGNVVVLVVVRLDDYVVVDG